MKISFLALFLSAVSMLFLLPPAANAEQKSLSKAEVQEIVRQYINDNPDVILKSVEAYQLKKQAEELMNSSKNIAGLQSEIQNDKSSPSVGNPNADVTVIEFFDYHCGYCRQFLPAVTKLVEDDPKVRVVFKELPILSEDSALAAKAALAVNSIDKGKYMTFHTLLMKMSGEYTLDNLTEKAQSVGIDAEVFKKAINDSQFEQELNKNKKLAADLAIHGTPGIIIGKELIPGAISYNELKTKVARARIENASPKPTH